MTMFAHPLNFIANGLRRHEVGANGHHGQSAGERHILHIDEHVPGRDVAVVAIGQAPHVFTNPVNIRRSSGEERLLGEHQRDFGRIRAFGLTIGAREGCAVDSSARYVTKDGIEMTRERFVPTDAVLIQEEQSADSNARLEYLHVEGDYRIDSYVGGSIHVDVAVYVREGRVQATYAESGASYGFADFVKSNDLHFERPLELIRLIGSERIRRDDVVAGGPFGERCGRVEGKGVAYRAKEAFSKCFKLFFDLAVLHSRQILAQFLL